MIYLPRRHPNYGPKLWTTYMDITIATCLTSPPPPPPPIKNTHNNSKNNNPFRLLVVCHLIISFVGKLLIGMVLFHNPVFSILNTLSFSITKIFSFNFCSALCCCCCCYHCRCCDNTTTNPIFLLRHSSIQREIPL